MRREKARILTLGVFRSSHIRSAMGQLRIGGTPARRRLEVHRPVVNASEAKHREILHVVLVYAPGRL